MPNSAAPTPVRPITATALKNPSSGIRNDSPSTIASQEKYCGLSSNTNAAPTVIKVNPPTIAMETRSINS